MTKCQKKKKKKKNAIIKFAVCGSKKSRFHYFVTFCFKFIEYKFFSVII